MSLLNNGKTPSGRGPGSRFRRAAVTKGQIYGQAATVPDVAPSRDCNEFLPEVIGLVNEAGHELAIHLLQMA